VKIIIELDVLEDQPSGALSASSTRFAEDVAIRHYPELGNNIVHWTDFETDGHFAALEAPDLLVVDIREFYGKLR
jgi:hypothetical protein